MVSPERVRHRAISPFLEELSEHRERLHGVTVSQLLPTRSVATSTR